MGNIGWILIVKVVFIGGSGLNGTCVFVRVVVNREFGSNGGVIVRYSSSDIGGNAVV